MVEGNLEVPFDTTVLGVTVTVQKVTQAESGIVSEEIVRDDGIRRRVAESGRPLRV